MTAELRPIMMRCAFCEHAAHKMTCRLCDCGQGLLAGIIPSLTLPVMPVGWLAFHALNHLPSNDEDQYFDLRDRDGRRTRCCRYCCGGCLAIFQLRELGLLDKLLKSTGKAHEWSWWDEYNDQVRPSYLSTIAVRCEQCLDRNDEDEN